jgi:zinc protease
MSSDSYGLPFDYAETQADRIAAVTLEGVNSRSRSLIDTESLTWLIVGDLAVIEEDVRALNFGDVEVWDAFGNKVR